MNYTLQSLTNIIKKCCKTIEPANGENCFFKFSLDYRKLENILQQKKTNLHVISLSETGEISESIRFSDIPLVTEYIHDKAKFDSLFSSRTEMLELMLFSTENESGVAEFKDINKKIGNFNAATYDKDIVLEVIRDFPCYRILVLRKYNPDKDQFVYSVHIRSDFNMVAFHKYLQSNKEDAE